MYSWIQAMLSRYVLRFFLNILSNVLSLTVGGSSFQNQGPHTKKLLSQKVLCLVGGTDNLLVYDGTFWLRI